MKKRKGKMIETLILPEAMIQHIQSFMREKEAVRSSILSKSWYDAWLTRPTLNIDEGDKAPKEFTTKTMQRYQDLNLKIESFRLRAYYSRNLYTTVFSHKLLLKAMKIGATNVEVEFSEHTLPQRLVSKTLLGGCVNVSAMISFSRLKSLTLKRVDFISVDVFKDIVSSCISLEELSLSKCPGLSLSFTYELRKLRRLFLDEVDVDSMFFTDFASRFPCLKDLTVVGVRGYSRIQIASTSLETVRFLPQNASRYGLFEVPNIRKFSYTGTGLLSIEGASREWELDLTLFCFPKSPSWCLNLKDFLAKFRLSRISLLICMVSSFEHDEVGIAVSEPLVLENLRMEEHFTSWRGKFHIFGICRPKFITQYRSRAREYYCRYINTSFDVLYKRLMQQVITPNCGIPNQDMFGKLGLKRVNMEVYETYDNKVWWPLVLKMPLDVTNASENRQKVRFELVWDL